MNHFADRLINLDTEHYFQNNSDLHPVVQGMSDVDRKLWLLSHFIKHGNAEARKHRLINNEDGATIPVEEKKKKDEKDQKERKDGKEEKKKKHRHKHSHNDDDTANIADVQLLIQRFRHKHGHDKGGKRDKSEAKKISTSASASRNVFWEITH